MFPSVKMGRICALLLNYPARPDQLRLEPFFLPPCIYLLILMSLQTALRKASRADVRPRCGTAWHGLALGSRGSSCRLGTWVMATCELRFTSGTISAFLLAGRCCKPKVTAFLQSIVPLCSIVGFITGLHLLLKRKIMWS